ncbi:hypothetical protein HDU96_010947 [Phlyctochytrium bullatum]|nr:hypothetical protein HDU96_010947 [Phlyctochytrium bullatum]
MVTKVAKDDDAKTLTSTTSASIKDAGGALPASHVREDIETGSTSKAGSITDKGSIRDDTTLTAIEVQVVPQEEAAMSKAGNADFLASTSHGKEPKTFASAKPRFLRHFELEGDDDDDLDHAFVYIIAMVHAWASLPTVLLFLLFSKVLFKDRKQARRGVIKILAKYAMLLLAMLLSTPLVVFFAFSGGALEHAFRSGSTTADRVAVGRTAVLPSLASFGVSQAAFFVIYPIIRALDEHWEFYNPFPSSLFVVASKFVICTASGAAGTYVNGQGASIGAVGGALYAVIVAGPFLLTCCCMDGQHTALTMAGIEFAMLSEIGVMVTLAVTSPGYAENYLRTGAILGGFGLGPFSSIAATFPRAQ